MCGRIAEAGAVLLTPPRASKSGSWPRPSPCSPTSPRRRTSWQRARRRAINRPSLAPPSATHAPAPLWLALVPRLPHPYEARRIVLPTGRGAFSLVRTRDLHPRVSPAPMFRRPPAIPLRWKRPLPRARIKTRDEDLSLPGANWCMPARSLHTPTRRLGSPHLRRGAGAGGEDRPPLSYLPCYTALAALAWWRHPRHCHN